MFTVIAIAVVAASVFGLVASVVFIWASHRSAAWNLVFGGALVLGTAAALLVTVMIAMWRFSH
jgi:hypothetical protein